MKNILFHLSIGKRLGLILLTFLFSLSLVTYSLTQKLNEGISFAQRQILGIRFIKPLGILLNEIADYQISSIQLKNGDLSVLQDMKDGAESCDKAFENLLKIYNESAIDLGLDQENLDKHDASELKIISLQKEWENIKASQNYDSNLYVSILEKITKLTSIAGDTSGMILDPDLDSYYLVDLSINTIPDTLNYLAGVKSKTYEYLFKNAGPSDSDSKSNIKLNAEMIEEILLKKIKKSIETSLKEDKNFYGESPTLKILQTKFEEYQAGAMNLIKMLRNIETGSKVSGDDFIKVADVMHDGTADLFASILKELENLIKIRSFNLEADKTKTFMNCSTSFLISLILFFFISSSISKPIKIVQKALQRISDGDTEFIIEPINGSDEISNLMSASIILRDKVAEAYRLKQMVQDMPTNVMTVDIKNDFKINYINNTSLKTLKQLHQYLPINPNQIIGKSIDIFHKNPSHQRILLSEPKNLPHRSKVKLGSEIMDLLISAIFDKKGDYVGAMLTWNIITAQEKLADDFERDVKTIVNMVGDSAIGLSQNAEEMNRAVKDNQQKVVQASNAASNTTSNVQSVASATEELSVSVREISAQLQKTKELVQESSQKAANADRKAEELKNASVRVNEVTKIISNISQNINLLALNATIESARAGEAGKGFAVVANEVKNLASQTNNSVAEIQNVINQMSEASNAITSALTEIKTSITEISSATSKVFASVEEQSAATNEISSNMQTAASSTQIISSNLDNVTNVSANAAKASESILNGSKELSNQADKLNSQVEAFLIKVRAG